MLKLLVSCFLLSGPIGFDWGKEYPQHAPHLKGHVHYSGTLRGSEVVYIGKHPLLSMETEVQVSFYNNKISKVLLILGPSGLDSYNCLDKYTRIVNLISEKYGNRIYVLDEKDPMSEDLVYISTCKPFELGLRVTTTFWRTPNYNIEAKLLGEEGEYFIEIRYVKSYTARQQKKQQKADILKKL